MGGKPNQKGRYNKKGSKERSVRPESYIIDPKEIRIDIEKVVKKASKEKKDNILGIPKKKKKRIKH